MSKGGAPQGIVFTQNITTFGGRVNAVQHGDQYNYIYRAEPPYQVEPFPLGHPTTPAPGLTRVPSRLLTARHQVVPFFPRPELELLAAWRDDAVPGMSVRLLHGEGGRGKTRLAAEFAAGSARAGWTVAQARHRSEVASAGGGDRSLTVRRPGLVLVVDYAERWPLADLLTLVRQHRDAARDRLRILLLSRPAGDWWQGLAHQFAKLDIFDSETVPLEPLPDDARVRAGIYVSARDSFAAALDIPEPADLGVPGELDDPQFALTLTVHMKALVDVDAARRGVTPPSGRDQAALSSYLLDREHDHWRSSHDGHRGPLRTGEGELRRAVYLATLTRPLPPADAASALTRTNALTGMYVKGAAAVAVADHTRCYPPQDPGLVFEALSPDRLAEDFLALTLPGREQLTGYHATDDWVRVAPALLLDHPVDSAPPALTRQVLTVMIEAAHRWPHLLDTQLMPLLLVRPALAPAAGGAALLRLCELDELPSFILERILPHLPNERHVELDLAMAVFTRRLVHHRLASEAVPAAERADLLHALAWRYGNAGLLAEALPPAQESVELYRELAAGDPGHLVKLALAVTGLAAALNTAGRYEEALAPTAEAVELHRQLAEADPAGQLPDLAMALNNSGILLLRVGQAAEAVAPAVESVDAYRRLAAADPDLYLPELATAVTNLSNNLSESGRAEDGLAASAEALKLHRRLAEADPDRHLPDLAMVAINHGWRLTAADRLDEALPACEEAVTLHQRLARVNPTAHLPRLAMAWDNLGILLARLGRGQDALAATREALAIREQLVASDPVLHLPDLAKSLTNLSIRISQTDNGSRSGDHSPFDGLAPAQRAVGLFRPLAEANPAHLPDFATALGALGHWHAWREEHEEALAVAGEELAVRRRLTEADPAAHRLQLAEALQITSTRYSRAGRVQEAFEPLAEEVAVRTGAAAAGQVAELALLHSTVALYSLYLVETGRTSEAVRVTALALRALETAVNDDPASYQPEIARGVVLLGLRLAQAGQFDQALLTTREGAEELSRLAQADQQAHLADCAHSLKAFALVRLQAGMELPDALGASGAALRACQLLAPGELSGDHLFPGLPDFPIVHAAALEALGHPEQAAAVRGEQHAR
ncbi:tetratricopeptide repeat protein [Streptomyces sp. NBC_01367]|uniref:tetratricopeptide repeat protein n=1 Tax=Streptomyces sp. NBC_01367 TaxID=2903841 RepID=UPI003249CDEE